MATAQANGLDVLSGSLSLPLRGVWWAELELNGDDASKVSADVELVTGDVVWKGTATTEVGAFVGRVKLTMRGGKNGLGKATKPAFYNALPARTIVAALLAEGGEQLSTTSDAQVLGTILPFWTRHAGTVGEGLENLLEELGATWRVLPDGTVWVGKETWPTTTLKGEIVESEDPKTSSIVFSSDSPSLLPGTKYGERRVVRVRNEISPGKTRTTAEFESGAGVDAGDGIRSALDGMIRQATKHVDLYSVRGGKVVRQNDDGTLELKIDDAEMPGMSKIPIKYGIPGITAKVKSGARIHVEFEDGSPAKPRATVVDSAGLEEVHVAGDVRIAGANDFLALAGKVDKGFADMKLWCATHAHPAALGPTGPPLAPPPEIEPVACKKTKSE